jgi:hypothetical protein
LIVIGRREADGLFRIIRHAASRFPVEVKRASSDSKFSMRRSKVSASRFGAKILADGVSGVVIVHL